MANQSLLLLRNDDCLEREAENTDIIVFGLTRPGLETTVYRTKGKAHHRCGQNKDTHKI
jgi:hypothetical protein